MATKKERLAYIRHVVAGYSWEDENASLTDDMADLVADLRLLAIDHGVSFSTILTKSLGRMGHVAAGTTNARRAGWVERMDERPTSPTSSPPATKPKPEPEDHGKGIGEHAADEVNEDLQQKE